jgi:alpha-amylase/alpha-mannosidase (GH57 family)
VNSDVSSDVSTDVSTEAGGGPGGGPGTDRYLCVHGHFYQPPRENPWIEVVEQQDSAWPYHDWNERITAECYAPNTTARILDDRGRITALVNNFARMSFNIGPTLLQWLQDRAPEVHTRVIEADERSRKRYGGHGSAMAQAYNHAILPLASERDRRTQVLWGIRDFQHRFGRDPEGMWLAEAAVDVSTLEHLAEQGIRFTVLSPYQAARWRSDDGGWIEVSDGSIDPTQPYQVVLPSGRHIAVFFYDAAVSQAVAFEGLLNSGDVLADRLLGAFRDRPGPQLVHIATDGESYGHHHRHGEMALAQALRRLARDPSVQVVNYGQYLELHPPRHQVEIIEGSSWSCAHGVERWRADCGCSTGHEGMHQAWRGPLRSALDQLRDRLAEHFEVAAGALLRDPWAARDDYIDVVLDRATELGGFLQRHAHSDLDASATTEVLRLLELQRHAMLMFTSCGWFFDEVSRIETIQILHYAARAIQLAQVTGGPEGLLEELLAGLELAESNLPEYGDGRRIFEEHVLPSIADERNVAAHFAISGLFHRYGPSERIGCFEVVRGDEQVSDAGRARLAYGQVIIRSVVTLEEHPFEYGVLHFGDHNFAAGVRPRGEPEAYDRLAADLEEAFAEVDFAATLHRLDEHFQGRSYSLRDLFRDEQQRILGILLDATLEDAEATYRSIYRPRAALMRFLTGIGTKLPPPLHNAAEIVVNAELRSSFAGEVDPTRVRSLIDEAERFGIELDAEGLAHALSATFRAMSDRIDRALGNPKVFARFDDEERRFFEQLDGLLDIVSELPFEVDLVVAQNVCWRVLTSLRPTLVERAEGGDSVAARWREHIDRLTDRLGLAVPEPASA